jgi:hypothetical protein
MSRNGAESELLLISEAVAELKVGMYGFRKQPEPIANIKRSEPRLSVGWGPQKEEAAKRIYEAIMQRKLSVFVLPASTEDEMHRTHLQVPLGVLEQMITTRGGLPDHAVAPVRRFAKDSVTPELLTALSKSALYVRRKEFEAWYKKVRKKRNWPSYSHYLRYKPTNKPPKPLMGRPSRQNDLRDPILALEGRWQTIADLVRLLESAGKIATRDTTRRVVDQLFRETGKECYRRRERRRTAVKLAGRPKAFSAKV